MINPLGIITDRLDLNKDGIITTNINKVDRTTFYTKFGNVFAQLLFIIMGVLILKTLFRYEKNI